MERAVPVMKLEAVLERLKTRDSALLDPEEAGTNESAQTQDNYFDYEEEEDAEYDDRYCTDCNRFMDENAQYLCFVDTCRNYTRN